MKRLRDNSGRFKRQRNEVWDFDRWDDGYIANGRFRIYRPDYPGCQYGMGYTERAWVVWWLTHGEVPTEGYAVHHIDENKLNDVPENLTLMTPTEHAILHKTKAKYILTCQQCGKPYERRPSRIDGRIKEGKAVKYCSMECLYEAKKAKPITKTCEYCGDEFLAVSRFERLKKRFCSRSCANYFRYQK